MKELLEKLNEQIRDAKCLDYIHITVSVKDIENLIKVVNVQQSAIEEIANDEEESSHERAESALWSAKSANKAIKDIFNDPKT